MPALSLLLAIVCSAQVPTLAQAGFAPAQDAKARAEERYVAGDFLAAAKLYAQALSELSERQDTRGERNLRAAGAVLAFRKAFELDPTQCETSHAGLDLADAYLEGLLTVYGDPAKDEADYQSVREPRDQLDQLRAEKGCPEPASTSGSTPAGEGPVVTPPVVTPPVVTPPVAPLVSEPNPLKRHGPGLAVGLGVSAALTVGMGIGTLALAMQLRHKDDLFQNVYKAAVDAGVPPPPPGTKTVDLCDSGLDNEALDDACTAFNKRHDIFITTAVLTGVFAASTAVFTGLLIRQRRQAKPAMALLRRHQARLGATPHLGGGASLTAGFRF